MPPTIDDYRSTPPGAINAKEGASTVLKCYADAKPEPIIKWYRWKKFKNTVSEKEGKETEKIYFFLNEICLIFVKKKKSILLEMNLKYSQ